MAEAQKYYALLTATGQAAMVKAVALGQTVSLTHMAVGDANGADFTPVESMTALVNEVHRAPVNALEEDPETPNMLVADLVIPHETGGFTVRELGIFDAAGNLFAIASIPPTYKPQMQEGGTTEIRFRMLVAVSNAKVVELIVDPTRVLATRDFVEKEVKDHNDEAAAHPEMQAHIKNKNDPHGTIPAGGETGQVLIKQADGGIAWGAVAGVPVGELCFSTNGVALPGTVPVNVKQKVLCSAFPQLFEWMKGGTYLTDETAWDAEAAAQDGSCGKYCWDGGDYFILPCYTRYFAAAHGDKAAGSWDGDAIRNITGTIYTDGAGEASGAFQFESTTKSYAGGDALGTLTSFDPSRVVPTAEENRPKTSYVLPCIKAFDVPINAAQIDMLALAQQVAAINGNKVDKGDLDYLNRVDRLLSTRSTTGTWTITGVTSGRPLWILLEGDAASTAGYATINLVSGLLPKTGQPIVFGNVSNYPRPITGLFIPNDNTVIINVSSLVSSPACRLHAYQ